MTFDDALKLLVTGHQIRISTWPKQEYLVLDLDKIIRTDGKTPKQWVPTNEDILSLNWRCFDWGTYYDKGYDEGYKVGYDEALEKYLEALNKVGVSGGHDIKQIILALKRTNDDTHKAS